MRRGEVWVANLNPNRGAEVGKVRPVVVVQADVLSSAVSNTIVVLPLTSQMRRDVRHLRITLPARERLRQECQVMVDQPRTLDRGRIGEGPLTRLTDEEMTAVERVLKVVLELR
jgi:mRNA interferase MazF